MMSGFLKEDIHSICALHPESPNFKKLVGEIAPDFEAWRNCRGDGNCFYRAVAGGLLDHYLVQEVDVKGFKAWYSNLYHQQFRIEAETGTESIIANYRVVLKVLYSLLTFKENQPGYLPYLLDKLLNSELFMIPLIEVFRHLAAAGAKYALQDYLLPEDLAEILTMGHLASDTDVKGLSYALHCSIVQVEIGTANYEPVKRPINNEQRDEFQLNVLLTDGHYSTLLKRKAQILPKIVLKQAEKIDREEPQ